VGLLRGGRDPRVHPRRGALLRPPEVPRRRPHRGRRQGLRIRGGRPKISIDL
jgi:hypothetical protein